MKIGITLLGAVALAATLPSTASAAVRIESRNEMKLEGALGKVANFFTGGEPKPETTTVAATASRKVSMSRSTGEIVDLDEGAVYHLDLKSGTYTKMTFDALREQVAAARRRAAAEGAQANPEPRAGKKPGDPAQDDLLRNLEITVDVNSTGRTRTINGFATREVVMRIAAHERGSTLEKSGGLALTSTMWTAKKIAALKEVDAFDQRFARKLAGVVFAGASSSTDSAAASSAAAAANPMLQDVLVRMRTEGEKMEGTPILTTTKVELVPSAEQVAELRKQQAAEAQARRERSRPNPKKGLGGMLGGIVTQAVEKKVEERFDKPADDSVNATIFTMTDEVVSISTDVSAADLAMPAGLRRVR
ncbi:MAG TPA: hypothetical protein VFK85_13515 [Anaeromyxobacteraceae bacterium]|nr:hypothetical protein [Anaeromyxobacteraceae bacterium]